MARGPAARGWCVYLLRCRDGSLYAGATNDVAGRLARHAAGKGARYTRSRLPVGARCTASGPPIGAPRSGARRR